MNVQMNAQLDAQTKAKANAQIDVFGGALGRRSRVRVWAAVAFDANRI